ncbi:T9SS type B sorting domain-containing protein [Flavobacterium phycosphaerae]|uniref:T9SS type B sorting domain-containing protein n=1 Tax=Flavobacterium phycosphaerae TaxID=2697515 RepID=UPI001F38138E|nr:T9SS type B sorting domain-containing protein [Flavobacterium phycosphaerae]
MGGTTNAIGATEPAVFTNGGTYAIPDNNTTGVNSPITVSGIAPTTITNTSIASVCLSITHAWDEDLDIFLECPNGTRIQLSTDNGTSGDNYTNTCFTPTSTNPVTSGLAPFSGTYSPEQAFSLLNGCNANGTWQLFVRDDAGAISGNITGWTITFNNDLPPFTWSPTTAMTNTTTLSPTVCPTSTTTYTLTGNNGTGCTTSDTVTVNVNASVTPTFTAVGPICSGATLSALPTTSTNGITGTWAPALNNTATTTYTFTPTTGQCATTTTLTITVNPNITPTFTVVAPICSGGTLSALPTTSNNSITGTWAPALNNTATTTYTFTPTVGQCATTATLTITVNPNITPTFTAVAPICSGGTLSALPTTSTNGISGAWTPALSNTATTTYTFTPTVGQCATTTTLTITVNPNISPSFTAVAPICSGTALSALPTTSNNGITGTWAPALSNTATNTYTFTPTAGLCATTTSLTITVNNNPTITGTLTFCNGSTSQLNGSGTPAAVTPWVSSNTAVATISSTGLVTGISNGTSTITYTDSNGCFITATITIATNIIPTFTAVPPICSGATLSPLPTTSNNSISGTWAPALDNTATTTYTFTPTTGQCAQNTTLTITVNPNLTPTFTAVAPICSGAALSALPTTSNNGFTGTWAPALNNTVTTTYTFTPTTGQCATITTLTITVNSNITPTFTAVTPICSGATLLPLPTTSTNGFSGTWSPVLNNTATTVYTFTPTTGQCATTTTLTITVNSNSIPNFTPVAPICSGGVLAALPTTSNDGFTGTWAPALDNTATTTYTFTPTTGQCALATTLTITVNAKITPTFTAVTPICSGGSLSALPTTSNNGFTGTWAPALDNTVTTTYTFTPSIGQCALTTTLTITVNPNIIPTFTAVTPICSGGTLSALPTTSNNGYTGTWSPTLNNTATTTYTFTPTIGQCATTTTLIITVNANPTITGSLTFCNGSTSQLTGSGTAAVLSPWISSNTGVATVSNTGLVTGISNGTSIITYTDINGCFVTATVTIATNIIPTFTAVAPICSGGTLSALPTTSNNSITGLWSPALDNTTTTTYTFTPTVGQCAVTNTLTINVTPNSTPSFTAVAPICSGTTLSPLPTTSNDGFTGSWTPALNNTATTTYTFTPTSGQCATTSTLTITVNPKITPTFTPVAPICSGAALSALPTTSNNGFTGTWSPAINNTATTTYTFTPMAGQCATNRNFTITVNPNITPTFTAVAPICSGGTLSPLPTTSNNGYTGTWSPALDNTATTTYTFTPTTGQCATTTTLTITVNPNITPTFTAVTPICSGGTLSALPTTSNNGFTGTWAPALDNTATTTYTFTPTTGQCATTTSLTITVNPNITPTFTAVAPICSGGTLSALPTTSNNGYTGTWTPALDNTATSTYTFTPNTGQCATATTLTITVNSKPTITGNLTFCNGSTSQLIGSGTPAVFTPWVSSNTAVATIDNTGLVTGITNGTTSITYTDSNGCFVKATVVVATNILPSFTAVAPICSGGTLTTLPTTSNNGITGTWAPALDNTTTTTYTFTPTTGQCALVTTLTITVNPNITPIFTAVAPICSGGTLSALPTTSNNGINGTWTPALDNTTTTTYTFTPTTGQCALVTTLTITVNPNITPTFTAVAPICSGTPLSALPTTSNNGYTGTWAPTLNNTTTTTYTFTPTTGQCATTTTLTITVNPNITPTFTAVAPICSGGTLTALPTTSNNGYTGTWSPIIDNTATTTYTFTPTTGQCATTTTLTITVNPNITPTFTAVAPICSGGTLTVLPTTSNNGYTGTWTPTLDNTATTTYTFTPTTGQCATTATLTITVNPNITPTFTAVAPICSGATLSPLPTSSNNGYTGTWSPTLNNTATTTYTFTPTTGQCALVTTLTITVNPNITPTFTTVAPICSGTPLPALPTASNNGYTGTWSPTLNNTVTTTYTFTPATGQCATTTTLTITVIPNVLPSFASVAPICSGDALSALPTTSNNSYTGTWSPALDNTSTTTYTFTPTTGQCATTASLTITVYALPLLNSLSPLYYCDPNNDGFGTFDLTQVIPIITGGNPYPVSFHETITDAQINGTVIPNPSAYPNIFADYQTIFIRVESVETSMCYKIITLELIVNPTPEATEPEDYHVCDNDYDGFASFNLTSITPEVMGTINPATHTITYYTSLANATSETNPISNLTNFINQTIDTQTIWIRVETTATGCSDIVTLQLIVDPLPTAMQPAYLPYSLCDDSLPNAYEVFDLGSKITDILMGQTGVTVTFYYSQTDAVTAVNPLPLLYTNAVPAVQTLWIRLENDDTGCFVLSTIDIRVEPIPSPIPPVEPFTICDTNQDGVDGFNLNTLTADILQGADYTITYHETITDAELGNNPLASPYFNLYPFIQFIYASAVDNVNGCRSVIPIELHVEPQPKMPITIAPLVQCDQDNNPQNLSMLFDLTQITPLVLANQDLPSASYTVTYYTSQANAIVGLNPVINTTSYTGANHQIIWVKVENNASDCFAIGSFELLINPPLPLITPTPLNMCDDDAIPNNLFTVFDLTVKNNEITQNQAGMTVTYYPSYPVTASSIPISNSTAYTNSSPSVQTLGVMVTNAQGCRSYTTLDIRVLPIPTPNNPHTYSPEMVLPMQCETVAGSGVALFDLTLNQNYITNGNPNEELHYFPTHTDLENNTNEIMVPTSALVGDSSIAGTTINQIQYVYIAVSNNAFIDYTGRKCYKEVQQGFIVNPLPVVATIPDFQICENDPSGVNDGFEVFDLTSQTSTLLTGNQTTPVSNYSVTFYEDAGLTLPINSPTTYINTNNPQPVFVQITNTTTGCKSAVGSFIIKVNPKPTATAPANFETCDTDGTNDGFFTLDLNTYINGIIGTQTNVTATFYNNQTEAQNGVNAITDLTNYQADTHTLWIRVEDNSTGCFQLAQFTLTVEKLAEPFITSGSDTICVEYGSNTLISGLQLNSGITNSNYTFTWSFGGTVIPNATGPIHTINTVAPGDYTVVATSNNPPLLGCVSTVSNTFTVIQSGPAMASNPAYSITNAFDANQIVTVNVLGFGLYEYSLDDGPFQSSNVFQNLAIGPHTVTVRDVKTNNSCGEILLMDIQTIDYPHYFTPNNDGFHDTWNVTGLENQPARLYIFDRYGKLLKQLSTSGDGWDGTYNGHELPATDYWFKVEYPSGLEWKEFKAHFSLKR